MKRSIYWKHKPPWPVYILTSLLTDGLEFRTLIGANVITQENNEFTSRTLNIGERGFAAARNRNETFWSVENFLTYNKRFKEIHSFTGLAGASLQESNFNNLSSQVRGFATDYFEFNNLGAGSLNPQVGTGKSRQALNSLFWKDKLQPERQVFIYCNRSCRWFIQIW